MIETQRVGTASSLLQRPTFGGLRRRRPHRGLEIGLWDETAAVLGIAPRSADRLWAYAKAWLHAELQF